MWPHLLDSVPYRLGLILQGQYVMSKRLADARERCRPRSKSAHLWFVKHIVVSVTCEYP